MASIEIQKSAATAEASDGDKATLEPFTVGGRNVQIATYRPGWKWEVDVKPYVKTETCQYDHRVFAHSGRMHVIGDDGTEVEIVAGDIAHLEPGHLAWVVGDEACVWFHILD